MPLCPLMPCPMSVCVSYSAFAYQFFRHSLQDAVFVCLVTGFVFLTDSFNMALIIVFSSMYKLIGISFILFFH